jgi:two-component system, NtrC family, sensor kinase
MSIPMRSDMPLTPRQAASPAEGLAQPAAASKGKRTRSRLFIKYVALFVAVVAVALLSNGIFEVFFYYREHKAALVRIQHEQAVAAAAKISQFIKEIESQLGWTTQLPWSTGSIEQRRFDALRLLRQVPAVTELAQVDSTGKERLRVSRLAMDVIDSGIDQSKEPKFTEAVAHKVYYGPVYFRRESEPYMTLAVAGNRKDAGVSIAEVNLKLIWDVVSQISVGEHGEAYVVGAQGRLIAHPDISLVLRNTDMSGLIQVKLAQANGRLSDDVDGAKNIQGREVLTASAPISPLPWTMFVELPVNEAYASLYSALQRLAIVLLAASILAVLAGVFLARRMVGPIQALRAGAARIGGGDFTQRISIRTGDELEGLANQFNDMGAQLQESYADLENKVEQRTAELQQSLEQQTATSEVLGVISSSPGDLAPIFQTMLENATRVCHAKYGQLFLYEESKNVFRAVATMDVPPAWSDYLASNPLIPADPTVPLGRVAATKAIAHVADITKERGYLQGFPGLVAVVNLGGARTLLVVPMLKENQLVGALGLYRQEVLPFTDKQIELVTSFARQAVIAIENARLLRELRERTDDLSESLQHQTGSANILRVIASSPKDVGPVLQAIVESACALCEAYDAVVMLKEGDELRLGAHHGPIPLSHQRWPNDRASISGRAMADRRPVHVNDVLSSQGAEFAVAREMSRIDGCRTLLGAPLLREGESVGAIVLRRADPHPFSAKQITLLQIFADQAVIAIENTRLFSETQEALERQTATADILKVIASSPSDVQPVFEAIATRANGLVGGFSATVFRFIDGMAHLMAFTPTTPEADDILKSTFPSPVDNFAPFQMARNGEVAQVADTETITGEILYIARARGFRSMLFAPLMNKGVSIGLIAVTRTQTGAFSDHHVQLLRTFADQAVIAIENVRLFDEVQAKTRDLEESLQQQTATAEVLKVISRSPDKLKPVLDVIVETSRELCNAMTAVMFLLRDGRFHDVAESSTKPEYIEAIRANPISLDQKGSILARAAREKRTVHIPNSADDPEAGLGGPLDSGAPRSLLSVPLILDGNVIGGITLQQGRRAPFTARQIEAVETFADQAVIAISNVNLFEQVQQRTRELAQSLDDLRTAQDRLIQTEKLASLGQLTAGIAHEIKNPLNFVNNFSALSTELIDELNELLKSAGVDGEAARDIDEIAQMLRGNLEKVVQHGKRADSIVKNMLLHSREGSGEHRPADINAIVEESLNLAYHGARAEKSGFNITLKRDLDPAAGMVDLYPQEITRVLLNLISNGFYAATKRGGSEGFEPTLTAATKDLGKKVEIRIRDNGTGIPPEVKEKIFNPFFTTKPAGEGTGLGLSMSHDIVVKQHGGTIDVQTEPDTFTEFVITLPRQLAAQGNTGG